MKYYKMKVPINSFLSSPTTFTITEVIADTDTGKMEKISRNARNNNDGKDGKNGAYGQAGEPGQDGGNGGNGGKGSVLSCLIYLVVRQHDDTFQLINMYYRHNDVMISSLPSSKSQLCYTLL